MTFGGIHSVRRRPMQEVSIPDKLTSLIRM